MITAYQWVFFSFMIKGFLLDLYQQILGTNYLHSYHGLDLSCLCRKKLEKSSLTFLCFLEHPL